MTLDPTQLDPPKTENFVTELDPTRPVDGPDPCLTLRYSHNRYSITVRPRHGTTPRGLLQTTVVSILWKFLATTAFSIGSVC